MGHLKAMADPLSAIGREIADIRWRATSIARSLEAIHGEKFKVRIGHDCSFVFVTRLR